MSVWIGALGSMVETLCASELPVVSEDRWMTGGGAGTLAPSRHLMLTAHGPGARTWRFGRDVCEAPAAASLASLARAQARTGQAYRMIPCGAVATNLLTPGASEELSGWSGTLSLAGIARLVEPETIRERVNSSLSESAVVLNESAVVDDATVVGGTSWTWQDRTVEHAEWGLTVTASGTVTSPVVPLLGDGPWTVVPAVHVKAGLSPVTVTAQALDAAGAVVSSRTVATVTAGTPAVPTRVSTVWTIPAGTAVSWRLRLSSTSGSYTVARPSLAQHDRPVRWQQGQGADAVVLQALQTDPILTTPDRHLVSVGYTAREDGV